MSGTSAVSRAALSDTSSCSDESTSATTADRKQDRADTTSTPTSPSRTSSSLTVQSFDLELAPTPKGRPRTTVRGGIPFVYTPKETRRAEEAVRRALRDAGAVMYPPGVPLDLMLLFVVRKPVKAPRYLTHPPRRPDLANYVMLASDAGTGVLWHDDAQLAVVVAEKRYGERPAIHLVVRPVVMRGAPERIGTSW